MAELRIGENSVKSESDLVSEEDIFVELCNLQAAKRVTEKIVMDCSNLKSNPFLEAELKSKLDVDIDIRYLISSNYIVFYRINDNVISVIRICDARTNYINVLFEE